MYLKHDDNINVKCNTMATEWQQMVSYHIIILDWMAVLLQHDFLLMVADKHDNISEINDPLLK